MWKTDPLVLDTFTLDNEAVLTNCFALVEKVMNGLRMTESEFTLLGLLWKNFIISSCIARITFECLKSNFARTHKQTSSFVFLSTTFAQI